MPIGVAHKRNGVVKPNPKRTRQAVVTSITLDIDAKYLLMEMSGSQSYGAFVSGLIRAEYASQQERMRIRHEAQANNT